MSAAGGFAARNAAIGLAVLLLAAIAGVAWWRGGAGSAADGDEQIAATADPHPVAATDEAALDGSAAGDPSTGLAAGSDPTDAGAERVRDAWRERLGEIPLFPDPLDGAVACARVEAELERVCAAIDAGVALEGAALQQGSCAFLRESADRLAARPPALPEARDPQAWISNAFHLFRALGEERLSAARALIDAEPALVEPLALAAYRWAITRESCRDDDDAAPALTPSRVYDYGALAFTSFGGQAYLRRRAPRIEALGCFYALAALELSIEQGHNPLGVDPRAEIPRCRALLDAQPFAWSAAYERELRRIDLAWRRRTGG